jgi:uncharacterized protein (TIGR03435 family)
MKPLAVYALAFAWLLQAQSFEVASVKPSLRAVGKDYNNQVTFSPAGFSAKNVTLKRLIGDAYSLQPPQVFGGPKWLDENEYDIEAKAGNPATKEQLRAMLQPLLAGRFHLQVHRETREMRVWEMVIDKGGPKFETAKDAKPGFTHFHGELQQLASWISVQLSIVPVDDPTRPGVASGPPVPVLDKTGLAGIYDFNIEIKAQSDILAMWQRILQEQLGLRLEARRSQVEGLVVDSAERVPTAN